MIQNFWISSALLLFFQTHYLVQLANVAAFTKQPLHLGAWYNYFLGSYTNGCKHVSLTKLNT